MTYPVDRTSAIPRPDDARERKSRRIAILALAAFAATVFAVNGTMILLAFKTSPGLAVGNAYERGLAYNNVLRAARDQAGLGWQTDLVFMQETPLQGSLELRLRDERQEPISRAEVEVLLVRPAEASMDFRAWLAPRGAGLFTGELAFPTPGLWDAVIAVRGEGWRLDRRERLVVE